MILRRGASSSYAYLTLLERCSTASHLKPIHAHMIILGLANYTYIAGRILAFYASDRGDPTIARQLFDQIPEPTLFHWNVMIRCHSTRPRPEMGLLVYARMRRRGVRPNMHTLPVTIKCCARLQSLRQIHGQVMRLGFGSDVFVTSSLVRCYSLCGSLEHDARKVFDESLNRNVVCWTSLISGYCDHGLVSKARTLFDEMPERNDSSWSAMITGYVQNELFQEALDLFRAMMGCSNPSPKPNGSLLVGVLNACACLGASEMGRWTHDYLDRKGVAYGLEIGTALVDFYMKTGAVESGREVFVKMQRKDVTAWSAMITGLAVNGYSQSALEVFSEMLVNEVTPNAITFIGVLTACSHGGLVNEGWHLFKSMRSLYGIDPIAEHYGCMVDLLARAGRIKEAEALIGSMSTTPDAVVWGALLNGCVMHGHKEVAERVGRILIALEPEHAGRYVGLANIYAGMGRWERVAEVRRRMKIRGVALAPGWSSIGIGDG